MERIRNSRQETPVSRSEYDTQLSETTDLDMEPMTDTIGTDVPPQLWAWMAVVAMVAAVLLAYATGGKR